MMAQGQEGALRVLVESMNNLNAAVCMSGGFVDSIRG